MRAPIRLLALVAALALASGAAHAASPTVGSGAWTPEVPVSMLGAPMRGLDFSKLNLSTTVSFGTGFGGRSEGLQVSRLSYAFSKGSLGVSVGSSIGGQLARSGGNPFFLEGLDFSYHPTPNMMFQVHYQNLVSPLQYQNRLFGDPAYIGY